VSPADPETSDPRDGNNTGPAQVGAGGCFDLQARIRLVDRCYDFLDDEMDFFGYIRNAGPNTAVGVVAEWSVVAGYDNQCTYPGSNSYCLVEYVACDAAAPCTIGPGQTVTFVAEEDMDCSGFAAYERDMRITVPETDAEPLNNTYSASFTPPMHRCFIATAAWGSPLDPHVQMLRDFRDRYLMTNAAGRLFVDTYYRLSPPIAAFIAPRPLLRAVVRAALTPIVLAAECPGAAAGVALTCCAAGLTLLRSRRRRRPVRLSAGRRRVLMSLLFVALAGALAGDAAASALHQPVGAQRPARISSPESKQAAGSPARKGPGASLEDLAAASDLVVLAEIVETETAMSGRRHLIVKVEEFLKGEYPRAEILTTSGSSNLREGDRAILFLVPALRPSELGRRSRTPGRFVFVESDRYLALPAGLGEAGEAALKGRVRSVLRGQGSSEVSLGSGSKARSEARLETSRRSNGKKQDKASFPRLRRILRNNPELKADALRVQAELLAALEQSAGSFQVDTATVDTLRDLAERLAADAPPDTRDALSGAMESIEALEGQTLDADQTEKMRQLLLILPGIVLGGRP
jgi:hypothetical protein